MDKEKYRKACCCMIYLISCMLNKSIPETESLTGMDIEELYAAAKKHSMLGITAYALENAGIKNERFEIAKARIIRKIVLFDEERNAIFEEFEKAGIWYLPLKGILVKDCYYKLGMRDMCDNDILCDSKKMSAVRTVMLDRGYKLKGEYGSGHDDDYIKNLFIILKCIVNCFMNWMLTKIYVRISAA